MIKKTLLYSFFLFYGITASGQSIDIETISSAGSLSGGDGQISWTIGELITETESSDGKILTQGLHQPVLIVNAVEKDEVRFTSSVFPNPTANKITVKFEKQEASASVEFYNAEGQLVLKEQVTNQKSVEINLSSFPSGLYFLYLKNNHQKTESYRVIKL